MDSSPGLVGLLPFWILIAGAVWIGSTAWLDPNVRRSHTDGPPGPDDPFDADRADWQRVRGPTSAGP